MSSTAKPVAASAAATEPKKDRPFRATVEVVARRVANAAPAAVADPLGLRADDRESHRRLVLPFMTKSFVDRRVGSGRGSLLSSIVITVLAATWLEP